MTVMAAGRTAGATNRLTIVSWALYDLADTIFSMNIISLYFSLWVVNVMGGSDADYGNANALAMLLVLLTAPALGALSDHAGRRIPFLATCALLCVIFTALLGSGGLYMSLAFFIVAGYMFQAALIFYEPLLSVVSTEETRGRISGLGVGVGSMGSLIGVATGLLLLDQIGYVGIFRLTALLFLLFALPCILFVKEPKPTVDFRLNFNEIAAAFRRIRRTLPEARRYPGLLRFLIGRFFYVDTANTVVIFMGIYVTNEIGFSEIETQILLLVAVVAGAIGGVAWGFVMDRLRPKRTLNLILSLWIVGLTGVIAISVLHLPGFLFWIVGCLVGVALGGIWTVDRSYLIHLAPPAYLGEFFGIFSMLSRFAAIVGPFLWGFIVNTLGWGRPAAIGSLLLFLIIGFIIVQRIDDSPRQWSAELQAG
ncbi:MAG: MFS transporter [Caldilineaceae bacterium]|nr:MFS transporter [Caldilineaceae bacterium]